MTRIPRILAVRTAVALALALIAAFCLVAGPASAGPIGFQASGGWYTDDSDFFLGAGARVGFARVTFIPNAEWLFVDSGSAYTLNLDGTLSLFPLGVASAYVGAGIGWFTVDPDEGDSDTETVANLLGGVAFNAIVLKPFAQVKWVLRENDDLTAVSAGIRF
jgi:hypothetical protein